MPARRTDPKKERTAPYDVKPTMAAAVLSPPTGGWPGMGMPAPPSSWSQHLHHYPPPHTSLADYSHTLLASSMGLQPQTIPPPSSSAMPHHAIIHRRSSPSQPQPVDGPWTADMDNVLMEAQARGLRWEQISQEYFPHKSANACRKRYGRAKEERRASDWDESRLHRMMAAYNKEGNREKMWNIIAHDTGERWQDIERICYSQGLLKMTRGRIGPSHSRSRVGSSRGVESRYPSPNDDYDPRDDSGIGLGMMPGHEHQHGHAPHSHSHHPTRAVQPPVTSSAPLDTIVRPSHQYNYGP